MNYIIAIPTYKRVATIGQKTLPYLIKTAGVNPELIHVFVADEQEYLKYSEVCKQFGVAMVVGKHTLCAQRNFINNYFMADRYIVHIDDDIQSICVKVDDKKYDVVTNLDQVIKLGFESCIINKTKFWGIAAVLNPYFMKHTISTDLKYVGGGFWGEIIDHSPDLDIVLEDKEDFERSIRYYKKFGSIIRLNGYSFKTNAYKGDGGMQETRTEQRIKDSVGWLLETFPEYCVLNTNREKHAEVRLIANPKEIKIPKMYDGLF